MKTTNETCSESNYSSFIKESYQKNSLGYFPLLKFKENLYNTCQSKFSEYINSKKDDIKLVINNKINQQISITDYIHNSSNDIASNKLTPIPSINKRKIKNEGEKKELKNFQRNVVLMRRLEYANKMKEKSMKKKYKNNINQIIYLQKIIRGYLVRKVINQVNIINDTLTNFIFLISLCIKKKYFYFLKNVISLYPPRQGRYHDQYEKYENFGNENNLSSNLKPNNDIISNMNINNNPNNNGNTIKNEFYNNKGNEYKLTHNKNFFEEEKNNEDENNIINKKEKLNIINDEPNINNTNNQSKSNNINNNKNENIKKEENKNNIYNNINNNIEENNINLEIKQNKTNTDLNNKNNNNDNITKEKRSMAKLTEQLNEIKNENNESNTINDKNIIKYNSPNNIDSIIENDDYVDFSLKNNEKKNIMDIKDEPKDKNKRNILSYTLSDVSHNNLRKTKTETIQRQFRQYLYRKGYYGNFDKRKIAIIFLLKNMILYNVKLYVFNILKIVYKDIKNISITQEDNYCNITSERIKNVRQIYDFAHSQLNLNFN